MSDITAPEQRIEILRKQLNSLVAEKGGNLNHPEIMKLSADLDELIVAWQKRKISEARKRVRIRLANG